MLEVNPQTVYFLILKAREFDVKDVPLKSEAGDEDEDADAVLEDLAHDPVVQEITETIDSLNEDEQAELVALVWLGRGDYVAEDWPEAVATAGERHTGSTASYLLGEPLLADYLEEGFSQLGYAIEDYE